MCCFLVGEVAQDFDRFFDFMADCNVKGYCSWKVGRMRTVGDLVAPVGE